MDFEVVLGKIERGLICFPVLIKRGGIIEEYVMTPSGYVIRMRPVQDEIKAEEVSMEEWDVIGRRVRQLVPDTGWDKQP